MKKRKQRDIVLSGVVAWALLVIVSPPAGLRTTAAAAAPEANLIADPRFSMAEDPTLAGSVEVRDRLPLSWRTGAGGTIHDSRFFISPPDDEGFPAVGIAGGNDRQGVWSTDVPPCEPGERYRFEAEFLRHDRLSANAYPEIAVWGQSFRLNTHRVVERFQPLFVNFTCKDSNGENDPRFEFRNYFRGATFWLKNPRLFKYSDSPTVAPARLEPEVFPLGVYGADSGNLEEIRLLGMNSAILELDETTVRACLERKMACMFSVPRDVEMLQDKINRVGSLVNEGQFFFYVNDEPGIHSFPVSAAVSIQRLLKRRYPRSPTAMAIVRPQVIPEYADGADYFLLDQYPIPHMPLTWLSDSLDEAAEYVGADRLQAVIQAFGDEKHASSGWPRRPSFAEMNCLAFLAVIHGARGLYFYTYPSIVASDSGKADFTKVIQRLNSLYSWLRQKNEQRSVTVRMTSLNRYDPQGRPAVHCARKNQYNTSMLLCVNTIGTFVEAAVEMRPDDADTWQEYFDAGPFFVVDGSVPLRFDPLEVKVLLEQ